MDVYKTTDIAELISGNPYVGRGIVIGKSADGKKAVTAYFIMGRSANSRNRIFTLKEGELFTEPFDAAKVQDPSLIIYAAVRSYENNLIVTNGNQTDTIYDGLKDGKCFAKSLESRCFEPDGPNWTPRISGVRKKDGSYNLSILKSLEGDESCCCRYFYDKETVKALLDEMAIHKQNFFHWHLTDDHGWRIQIDKYPELTTKGAWRPERDTWDTLHPVLPEEPMTYGGFYTKDQIREVIEYAAARHIDIIPFWDWNP